MHSPSTGNSPSFLSAPVALPLTLCSVCPKEGSPKAGSHLEYAPSSHNYNLRNHCYSSSRGPGVFTHVGCTPVLATSSIHTHTATYIPIQVHEHMCVPIHTQVGTVIDTNTGLLAIPRSHKAGEISLRCLLK